VPPDRCTRRNLDVSWNKERQLKFIKFINYFLNTENYIKLPIGYPIAKSLDCVQKIANIPDFPTFSGRITSKEINKTEKNAIDFEIKIASRKSQLTVLQLTEYKDIKIVEGRANVPT
jgi:hypothetical protein